MSGTRRKTTLRAKTRGSTKHMQRNSAVHCKLTDRDGYLRQSEGS